MYKPLTILAAAALALASLGLTLSHILPSAEHGHAHTTIAAAPATGAHRETPAAATMAGEARPGGSCGDLRVVGGNVCVCINGREYMETVLGYVETDLAFTRALLRIEAGFVEEYNSSAARILEGHIKLLEKKAAQLEEAFEKNDLKRFICTAKEYVELREKLMREDTVIVARVSVEALREAASELASPRSSEHNDELIALLEELASKWDRMGEEARQGLHAINASLAEEFTLLSLKTVEAIDKVRALGERARVAAENSRAMIEGQLQDTWSELQDMSEKVNGTLERQQGLVEARLRRLGASADALREWLEDLANAINSSAESMDKLVWNTTTLSNSLSRLREALDELSRQLQLNITVTTPGGGG